MDSDDSKPPFPTTPTTTMTTDQTTFDPFSSTGFESFSPMFEPGLEPEPEPEPEPFLGYSESYSCPPQPLECLHEPPIPPFLSKTYEMVDDRSLDPIISWSSHGGSFVVWDPVEFSRVILPRNFKHNNFSSFVRQLNTYGFRKIDPDKWEFASEGFLRGKRHLLKNIHRRRSPHSQHLTTYEGSSSEASKSVIGSEIDKLRKEKSALMQEVVELQQQQRGTVEHMEKVKHRLQASEQRQKQMVSFLAKVFQNPTFIDRLKQMKEQRKLGSPRTKKKFLKQKPHGFGGSGSGELVRYKPDLVNLDDLTPSEIPGSSNHDCLLQDVVGNFSAAEFGTMPFQAECSSLGEFATTQEMVDIPFGFEDPLLRGKQVASSQSVPISEGFTIPELSSLGIENMIKQEDIWNMDFDPSAGMCSSSPGLWGNVTGYNIPDMGPMGPGDLSDIADLGSLGAGSSGVETWPSNEYPLGDPENQGFESKGDVSRKTNS